MSQPRLSLRELELLGLTLQQRSVQTMILYTSLALVSANAVRHELDYHKYAIQQGYTNKHRLARRRAK